MSTENKLWIITIPGPDEIYAAPSYEVAQLMKASHDKSMTEWLTNMQAKGEMLRIRAEDMMAVIEEFDDAEDHAELMEEFSHADWGITEDDLRKYEDSAQPNLFDQDGDTK
jgi:hypothetical protein